MGGCCPDDDRPTLRLQGDGAKDVYFVMCCEDCYHPCKQCKLAVDEDNVLCDERGRRLSTRPIIVPFDADEMIIRSDGMVVVRVADDWCGIGQLHLIRVRDPFGGEPVPKPCKRLWEMGIAVIPGKFGEPQVKPVHWLLREPVEMPEVE